LTRPRRLAARWGGGPLPPGPEDRNPDAKIQLSSRRKSRRAAGRHAARSYLGRIVVPLMMPPTFFAGPPIAAVAEAGRTIPVPLMTALPAALSLDAPKLMLFCGSTFGLNTLVRRRTPIPIAFVPVPGFLAITLSLLVVAMPAAFLKPSAPFAGLLLATPETSCVSMPIEFRAKPP